MESLYELKLRQQAYLYNFSEISSKAVLDILPASHCKLLLAWRYKAEDIFCGFPQASSLDLESASHLVGKY